MQHTKARLTQPGQVDEVVADHTSIRSGQASLAAKNNIVLKLVVPPYTTHYGNITNTYLARSPPRMHQVLLRCKEHN